MSDRPLHLLFVCIENSCRSQMAEGFARAAGRPGIVAASAGSRPAGEVDRRAIRFMAEKRIDLAAHTSKSIAELPAGIVWDYVVTMGCGDACPYVPARRRLDWDLSDPKNLDDDGFRRVRDRIADLVSDLVRRAAAGGPESAPEAR